MNRILHRSLPLLILLSLFLMMAMMGRATTAKTVTNPAAAFTNAADAFRVIGRVLDKESLAPLEGAIISVKGTSMSAISDRDGLFRISAGEGNIQYVQIVVMYTGYQTLVKDSVRPHQSKSDTLRLLLQRKDVSLTGAGVRATRSVNTERAVVQNTQKSANVLSVVSSQEITRNQDSNAGEAVKRVSGVSLIDDKFVMVRGLSQRYNNVWINGGAVPSSEADSRAFSFDILPASQIDNLTIVKSPAAEYPADCSGGFIMIETKDVPSKNTTSVYFGGNINDATHFSRFIRAHGSSTDFLGFDGGLRSLKSGIHARLRPEGNGTSLLHNSLNNNWYTHRDSPLSDLKTGGTLARRFNVGSNRMGLLFTFNYTNEYRTYKDMQNNLFGVYDTDNDRSNYLRHSIDQQYNHNVRLGGMLNLTLLSANGHHRYQWKNIFNQLGTDRYTSRQGISAQANQERSAEYYYRSRTTINSQFGGRHTFSHDLMTWDLGHAYANRHIPDRRRYLQDDALESGVYALTTGNDISREWTQLDEHIFSARVNDSHKFSVLGLQPTLKAGAYAEYRIRKYTTRDFIYNWNASSHSLPSGFRHMDIPVLLSNSQYFGEDGLYLLEQVQWRNNYRGHNTLGAGFVQAEVPIEKFNFQGGLRFEHNDMAVISNTRDAQKSETTRHYRASDFFPSLNLTYRFNTLHQLRLCYGRTINRPEFRELSPSVFYDFDLASNVQGNTELKNCYIHNLDLRYEFYPSRGEMVSLAVFYKHFRSPIEWTYTVAGGTDLIYSYKNARNATNYGVELDIRKSLAFIGLKNFSLTFNGALIKSRVRFSASERERNRPMQGQSPFLINTGIIYSNDSLRLQAAVLYNCIGKRIIGVGRSEGSDLDNSNARVPDSYEMPRHVIDLTVSKKLFKHLELRLAVRDLLAQKVYYKQFANVSLPDGVHKRVAQITRSYRPGRNFALQMTCNF